jgi:glycosyltransferase involved in cell wall biosynthesis
MAINQKHPKVSIIMATYNERSTYISASIDSILEQTFSDFELILIDDSTNINTIECINSFAGDHRVRIIRGESRYGFVNALNVGLAQAEGELIARMDGDDIALPNRLQDQVEYADRHPQIDVFGGSINIIDGEGKIVSERNYPSNRAKIWFMFLFRSPFAHPTIMFRRKIMDAGFLYDVQYIKAEDIDFLIRLFKQGYKFGNLERKVLNYRVCDDMSLKRTREQWIYNHKARSNRIIWGHPIFSILSYCISFLYVYIPQNVVSYIYRKENSKYKTNIGNCMFIK